MGETDLEELLKHCRGKNERRGITGLLYYFHNSFIQLLEGAEEDVKVLYETIIKDKRHQFVRVLKEGTIQERFFPDWTMGYKVLSAAEIDAMPAVEGVVATETLLRLFEISGNKV